MSDRNSKQSPVPVVPRTMKIVNEDGTITRSGQLLLEQLQPAMVMSGGHDQRPDTDSVPDGALYIEEDRSGVIYQNQGGEWHYIAGTMWSTLSPDTRPADLGVNDAGFVFRSTDPPPREYIWSGTVWVDATGFLDPTTTKGDLIARGTAAPATRLGVGSDGRATSG